MSRHKSNNMFSHVYVIRLKFSKIFDGCLKKNRPDSAPTICTCYNKRNITETRIFGARCVHFHGDEFFMLSTGTAKSLQKQTTVRRKNVPPTHLFFKSVKW
jgi:hypothetical protein